MQGTPRCPGIVPRSFCRIFEVIQRSVNVEYLVRVSCLEIYNEVVRDLLDKNGKEKLELRESKEKGVYIKHLRTVVVETLEEMHKVLEVTQLSLM